MEKSYEPVLPNHAGPVHSAADLDSIYQTRFRHQEAYRKEVWKILAQFFSRWIPPESAILDLGCGYCEFINEVRSSNKFGMDLNPQARKRAASAVRIFEQDCSEQWPVSAGSLTTVFTSNFLEHLPAKGHLERTLLHAYEAIAEGGRFIAMGPNVKCVPGAYWDFYDHYIPLTELSMKEILVKCGFEVELCCARFLPYSMSQGRTYPLWMLRSYLNLPAVWPLFGKQFLVVAKKTYA